MSSTQLRIERATLVAGVLLVACLTLLPFHTGGPAPTHGGDSGRTAIQDPAALAGIAATLAAAGLTAWLACAQLLPRPRVAAPVRGAAIGLAGASLALVVAKLAAGTGGLRVGAWGSLLLGTAFVALAAVRPGRRP